MNPKPNRGSFSGYTLGNLYTLRGLASLLGVSTGLIYKIETIFGLRNWSSRLPGRKSEYSEAQKNFFCKVNFLSNLHYANLVDIKALYELEKRIKNVAEHHFYVEGKVSDKKGVGILRVFLIAGLDCPQEGIKYDRSRLNKNKANAEKLKALHHEYVDNFKKILETAHRRQEEIENEMGELELLASSSMK